MATISEIAEQARSEDIARECIDSVVEIIDRHLEGLSCPTDDPELNLMCVGLTVLAASWKNGDLDDTAYEELLGTIYALNRVWCYHVGAGRLPGEPQKEGGYRIR